MVKKTVNKWNFRLTLEQKNSTIALIFLFIWVISILATKDSKIWIEIYKYLTMWFGVYYKWIFSPVLILSCIFIFKEKDLHFNLYRFFGLLFFYTSLTTIFWFFIPHYGAYFNLYHILTPLLWSKAVLFSSLLLFIWSLVILFRFSPVLFVKKVSVMAPSLSDIKNSMKIDKEIMQKQNEEFIKTKKEIKVDEKKQELERMILDLKREKEALAKAKEEKQLTLDDAPKNIKIEKKEIINPEIKKIELEKKSLETQVIRNDINEWFKNWEIPDLNLLDVKWWKIVTDENEIRRKEIEIQEKLLQFSIKVTMEWYKVWPTVIQFRLKPSDWVKLQKIENLKKDLTLALHAKSIRIQAPIPWLWVVGIEVPNDNRQTVWLKEVLESEKFTKKWWNIPIAVWKDVNGDFVVWDLTKMPHLLVAWQTASWKSVWMNGFLISMLYKFSPSDLKMILIDPKRVELSVYNGIPHLLVPVITDPDKALNSLKWCVAEMLRRYDLATWVWARNLEEYNDKVDKQKKLPYIVIVVDELADLMMSWNKKEVETSIARIAQMARAVWMHLIVATQRPSVDVITWLIKANIPSRIAFTVASQIDSRTVIDKWWAEDLLGRWDMLYFPTWSMEPERVQWVFVETHEVEAVVNRLKLTIDPDMLNNLQDMSIINWQSNLEWSIMENYKWDQDESPDIIEKAIQVVKESKKGSTSLIQRKLWLWYARAAKVLDILEELGVVGPSNGSKPRDVYVD